MKRKILPSIGLFAAALVMAFALAEGLVRIFAPHTRDHVLPGGLLVVDPVLGWRLQPSRDAHHRTRYFDVRYTTNSMGFRDTQRSPSNVSRKRRALLYGDSQIFGWGVNFGEQLTALVENDSLEVWNMGVPGYGLDQEILLYERDGESVGATDVVFFVSKPTTLRTRHAVRYHKPKPRYTLDSAGSLRLESANSRRILGTDLLLKMAGPLYLPYFLDIQAIRRSADQAKATGREIELIDPELTPLVLAMLGRARELAKRRNQRMAVLVSLSDPSATEVRDFCERNGIGYVSTPWATAPRNLTLGKTDGHWTPEAHRMIAARLSAYFDSSSVMTDTISASDR